MVKVRQIEDDIERFLQGEENAMNRELGVRGDEEDNLIFYNALIQLSDNTIIDLSTIYRIDKDKRFITSLLGRSRFEHAIVINRNVKSSNDIPNVDVEIWYEVEEKRDEQFEQLKKVLLDSGRNIRITPQGVTFKD